VKPRSARAGISAAAVLLGAALLVGANYLAARHWARFDWTKTQLYSLSETTKKTVRGLTKPVRVTVFMTERSRVFQPVRELLSRYRDLSPRIEVEYLDPQKNPARAQALVQEFGIRQNTVVFRSGDRKKYVEEDKLADYDYGGASAGMPGAAPSIKAFKGEEAFTSALLAVTETRPPKIYFSAGHGEASLDSFSRGDGFAELKQLIERDNMTVAAWDSLGKGSVPSDADAVVVAGPRTGFLEPETAALEKYLAGGGGVLFLLDPVFPTPGAPPSDYALGRILSAHGVRLGNDLVVDPANAVPLVGAETLIANRYGSQPIVRSLSEQRLPVVFPLARSVARVEPAPPGITLAMLVETTPEGWGETALNRLEERVEKDAADNAGPVTLAFAVSPEAPAPPPVPGAPAPTPAPAAGQKKGRAVVVGNSRFAANGSLNNAGNANFALNSLHWLTGAEKKIGIAPKTLEQASLSLTQTQVRRIALFTTLGMPALAILLGVWVWYRRRD
jgi:ABC-type uncharacterized transport system involved in gliding motility auxiliary subunit